MSEATTALAPVNTDMVAAATPRQPAPVRGHDAQSSTRRTQAPADDVGSKAPSDKGLRGADAQRSFAATLDSVDAQAPAETQPAETPEAPRAAETSNPAPETSAALTLLSIPVAGTDGSTGTGSQPGGNSLPQTGNMSPDAIAPGTAQRAAQQWAADAASNTGEMDSGLPRIARPTPQAATPNGASMQDPSLPTDGRQISLGPVPTTQSANGDASAETARSESLRAGILDSFALADKGADASLDGGDARSGDGRRQLPDGLMRLVPSERADLTSGARVTAEFNLNAATAPAQTIESGVATARLADPTTLDVLSGQRPLQPLGDQAQWSQGLGQRLMMMADGGVQSARIRLHPEHLGQLDVRIEIEDDTARVWFNATSSQARDAIESALPKLRELFDSSGLDLVGTDVSDDAQRFAANSDAAPAGGRAADFDADAASANDPSGGHAIMRVSDRLVDFYA